MFGALQGGAGIDAGIWGWVAYIVALPTILAYLLNIWALRRVSHNVVAVYIYLQPLMTALVAPLVLAGEELTARAAAAGLAIFSGVGMVLGGGAPAAARGAGRGPRRVVRAAVGVAG